MRHRNAGNHLSRTSSHRAALARNLAASLIEHERIVTTVAKAKNVRPFVEKLVTLAKEPSQHHRRLAFARLRSKQAVHKLFEVLGPRFRARPGGYTRILKLARRRLGDRGERALLEFVERTPKEAPAALPPEKASKRAAQAPGEAGQAAGLEKGRKTAKAGV